MSNLNTFADVIYQQNNRQPIPMTLNQTGTFAFSLANGESAILPVPNSLAPLFGPAFQQRPLVNTMFKIRAAGTHQVNSGVSFAVAAAVHTTISAAPFQGMNGTTVSSASGRSGMWGMEYTLQLATNGSTPTVMGYFTGWVLDGGNIIFTSPTFAEQSLLTTSPLQFNMSVFVNSGNPAGNQFTLTEFSAELL